MEKRFFGLKKSLAIALSITNFCLQYTRSDCWKYYDYYGYDNYDYYRCRDASCDGGYYWMDGLWGTFFSFIASIIAWAGSCKRIPETFSVLYRVQATFVSFTNEFGIYLDLGHFGHDHSNGCSWMGHVLSYRLWI